MKKKGFTLIELISVIIILALVSLITVPMILGVIEKAKKGAASSSALGYIDAIEKEISIKELKGEVNNYDGTYDNLERFNEIEVKGTKPSNGSIIIKKGNVEEAVMCIDDYTVVYDGNKAKIEGKGCKKETSKIYGIKREINSSQTTWERIEDSVGLVANAQIGETAVQNDFDNIYPWSEIKSYNYDLETNKITAWYGEENFKFDGSNGEVLTRIPEFYYKREQKDGYEYIYITKSMRAGYTKSSSFSVGRYTISGTGEGDIHSRSGKSPLTSKSITEFRNYAKSLGPGFGQMDYHYFILQLLYLVEYADYNSQDKLGLGYANVSHTSPITSGGCDSLGMKSGSADGTDNTSVIYRGIEDIYGNVWQFVDGINIKDYQAYICYNQSKYESDKFDGCYKKLGYVNASSDGYISKLGYDSNHPLISFPTEVNGTSTTYISDYYWKQPDTRIVLFGASYTGDSRTGMWTTFNVMKAAYPISDCGARLIKIN